MRTRIRRFLFCVMLMSLMAVVFTLTLVNSSVHAQESPDETVTEITDDQVNGIAKKLYCPVCENITLDTCPTAACEDWRYEIRLQLEAGLNEQQIIEDFVRRFGDRVVGTPVDPFLHALSVFTPWVLIALCLVAAAQILAKKRDERPQTSTASANDEGKASDRYQDIFERDVTGS